MVRYTINTSTAQWRIVDGEAVVVNVESSYYYGLNHTGTFVWSALSTAALTIDDLAREVGRAFDVDETRARTDVEALLRDLRDENLLTET